MKVVFADVDNGLMLKKKGKTVFLEIVRKIILENILGTNGRKIDRDF